MQLLANALIAGSLAALIAAGLQFVYGVLGIFNLALGQLALVGGFATWWLYDVAGLPLWLAIVGGVACGAIVTAVTFEIAVAPFYRRHPFLPLVTTIAWSMILDAVLLLCFQEFPRNILQGKAHFFSVGTVRMSFEQLTLVVVTVVFLCSVAWALHKTSFGRRIHATVQHPDAARSIGIPSHILHRVVFICSGVLAALGGIYIGIDQNLTPTIAFTLTIKAYAAIIAGGKNNLWGAIICAYAIALIEQLAVGIPWWFGSYIMASFQGTVALAVIIAVLLWKPQGLFSSSQRAA